MKSPAPVRRAARKNVRLDLRRAAPPPEPEDQLESRQKGSFWKWFGLVALFHVVLLTLVAVFYKSTAAPPPPAPFISLMPPGDVVKGTPGTQAAPKLGASTRAPSHPHHHPVPKPVTAPSPVAKTPPPVAPSAPKPVTKKVVIKKEKAPPLAVSKPKPVPPKPKVKVDLHLVDDPAEASDTPAPTPRKKTPAKPSPDRDRLADDDSAPETSGLSREQIAQRLGQKLDAAGVTHADRTGASGAPDGNPNPFADFYASITQQTMEKWQNPDSADQQAINPVVEIHVEKDGRVPSDRVRLRSGSGNPSIDDSALNAARHLGYTLQPLPDGCPPDISITFQLSH